jgi:hypothetical protein
MCVLCHEFADEADWTLNPTAGLAVTANGEPLRVEPPAAHARPVRSATAQHATGAATLELERSFRTFLGID